MSTGRDIICAAAKGTTWGTAVGCNSSGDAIIINSSSGFHAAPEQLPDESAGFNLLEYIDLGGINVAPTLNFPLRFDNQFWLLVACLFGEDSASGSTEITHLMRLQGEASTASLFSTLCLYDGQTVREIPSFKPTGFIMRGSAGGFMEGEITGIGDKVLLSGQTNTTLASATAVSEGTKVPFGIADIQINAQSGGALSSSDRICPTSFEISVQRQMEQDFTACANTIGQNANVTQEPVDGGFVEVNLSLELPNYTTENYLTNFAAGTEQKAEITFTGETISSAPYSITWQFPSLHPTNATGEQSGPGRIPTTLEFRALQAQSTPTGMGQLLPNLTVVNTTSDYIP